jgi:hypothetical protein
VTPVELTVAVVSLLVLVLSAAVTTVVRDVDAVRALGLAEEGVAGADGLLWLTERPLTTHRVSAAISVLGAVAIGIEQAENSPSSGRARNASTTCSTITLLHAYGS